MLGCHGQVILLPREIFPQMLSPILCFYNSFLPVYMKVTVTTALCACVCVNLRFVCYGLCLLMASSNAPPNVTDYLRTCPETVSPTFWWLCQKAAQPLCEKLLYSNTNHLKRNKNQQYLPSGVSKRSYTCWYTAKQNRIKASREKYGEITVLASLPISSKCYANLKSSYIRQRGGRDLLLKFCPFFAESTSNVKSVFKCFVCRWCFALVWFQ